jgi:hypothetical protein
MLNKTAWLNTKTRAKATPWLKRREIKQRHGDGSGQAEKRHDGVYVVVGCLGIHLRLREVGFQGFQGFQGVNCFAQLCVYFGTHLRPRGVEIHEFHCVEQLCAYSGELLQHTSHLFKATGLVTQGLNFVEHGGKHVLGQLLRVFNRGDVVFGFVLKTWCLRVCSSAKCVVVDQEL